MWEARPEALAEVARSIDLGSFLVLAESRGRQRPRRRQHSLRRDGGGIAALYLDGGLDVARDFILGNWNPLVRELTAALRKTQRRV